MPSENASVFRGSQWGVESTSGTVVAANRRLFCTDVMSTPATRLVKYRPVGRKYTTTVVKGKEHTTANLTGVLCFNDIVYLLSGLLTTATITTPTGATNTRNWQFLPSTTGPDTPKTFTIETGSSVEAERFSYGLVNGLSLHVTENPPIEITGSILGWALTEGITLASSPTAIPESPVDTDSVTYFVGSSTANEVQTLLLNGGTGNFTLTFTDPYGRSATTGTLSDASSAANVQTALRALSNFAGDNVTVTGSTGVNYIITFQNLLGGLNVPIITFTAGTFTGGPATVTETTPGGLTALDRALEFTLNFTDRFTPEFTLKQADPSFSAHVEKAPTFNAQLILQHDATTSVALMADLRARTTKYLQMVCVGPVIETGFYRMLTVRLPLKLIESVRGDHSDVWGNTYTLEPLDDGTSVLEVNVRNSLTAL